MVQARQQRHLALDSAEMPAGRVDGDALHRVAAAVQLVLHLPRGGGGKEPGARQPLGASQTSICSLSPHALPRGAQSSQ